MRREHLLTPPERELERKAEARLATSATPNDKGQAAAAVDSRTRKLEVLPPLELAEVLDVEGEELELHAHSALDVPAVSLDG
jgi:hypothetical protein